MDMKSISKKPVCDSESSFTNIYQSGVKDGEQADVRRHKVSGCDVRLNDVGSALAMQVFVIVVAVGDYCRFQKKHG